MADDRVDEKRNRSIDDGSARSGPPNEESQSCGQKSKEARCAACAVSDLTTQSTCSVDEGCMPKANI